MHVLVISQQCYKMLGPTIKTVTPVSWKVRNECGSTLLQASESCREPNGTEAKRNEAQNITKVFWFLLLSLETPRSDFRDTLQESV
jgi:hypothetical protein